MDFVGRPLRQVSSELREKKTEFTVVYTHPTRDLFKVDPDELYIIRQRIDEDGLFHLTAAAKLRKEV